MRVEFAKFRHRVKIQTLSKTRDAGGRATLTWSAGVKRWASVEPVTGTEYDDGQAQEANVTHRVKLRYDKNLTLTPKQRIVLGTRNLEVVQVLNTKELDTEYVALCKEGV